MSPESIDYMGTADRALSRAQQELGAGILDDAARNAYIAALNAVRAVIFERTGDAVKTHSGARSRFHELIRGGMAFDRDLVAFLGESFEVKQQVDYGPLPSLTASQAARFVEFATRFVAAAKKLCGEGA